MNIERIFFQYAWSFITVIHVTCTMLQERQVGEVLKTNLAESMCTHTQRGMGMVRIK